MRLELSLRAQADLDDIRDSSVEQFGVGVGSCISMQ